jgi:hypothetical protein
MCFVASVRHVSLDCCPRKPGSASGAMMMKRHRNAHSQETFSFRAYGEREVGTAGSSWLGVSRQLVKKD